MRDNEGVRVTDAPCCLLCGSEGLVLYSDLRDRLFGAPGIWTLMRCPKCQLVWVNPQPIPDDVGKLYAQYFTHTTPNSAPKNSSALRKLIKASILESSFGYSVDGSSRMLGSLLSLIGPLKEIVGVGVKWLGNADKGRLLDVGCGNGSFLDQMRSLGWEVVGVEPDSEAVSVACERYGLDVFRGSLEAAVFPDGYFDAITLNHVIEHVQDPIGLLEECRRVLKPGGKLVVVTPNVNSLGRRTFDESWLHWDPPRHLYLFSSHTLRVCAEVARLDIQELRTTTIGASGTWAASSFIMRDGVLAGGSPGALSTSLKLQCLAFWGREHGLSGRGGMSGEGLVMVARR